MAKKNKMCEMCGPNWFPWLVLLVGVLFLLRDLAVWDFWNISGWSAVFVLVGLHKLTCCK